MTFANELLFKLCCLGLLIITPNRCDCAFRYDIKSTPNVGTVLFRKQDVMRSCWAIEDVGFLLNRYIFQGILPLKSPTDIAFVLTYVTSCMQFVNDEVKSKNARRVLLHPLVDVLGGYLKGFSIPTANELFYEGNICTRTVIDLHKLYSDMQYTLKTDGSSWTSPLLISERFHPIRRLVLNQKDFKAFCKDESCCSKLLFDTRSGAKPHLMPDEVIKHIQIETANISIKPSSKCSSCNIPMPFYDDCINPHAIAMPLKNKSLYSMTSNTSFGILTKFYKTAMYCFKEKCRMSEEKSECKRDMMEFNRNFYFWMLKEVIPFLKCKTWYPAFYEVLRVFKTTDNALSNARHNQSLFLLDEKSSDATCWITQQQVKIMDKCGSLGPILLGSLLVFLFLVFCCRFCYCTIRSPKDDKCQNETNPKSIMERFMELSKRKEITCQQQSNCQIASSDKTECKRHTSDTADYSRVDSCTCTLSPSESSRLTDTNITQTNCINPVQDVCKNIETHFTMNFDTDRFSNIKPLKTSTSSHTPKNNPNVTKNDHEPLCMQYMAQAFKSNESLEMAEKLPQLSKESSNGSDEDLQNGPAEKSKRLIVSKSTPIHRKQKTFNK